MTAPDDPAQYDGPTPGEAPPGESEFDVPEYERYVLAAEEQVDDARTLADHGSHNSAVLHLEQAAQLLLKGLLRAAGLAAYTRTHGLRGLAERCRDELGLDLSEDHRGDLARLERDYQAARYPDALPAGTPRGAYDREDYQRARATVEALRARVAATWQALVAAAQAGSEEG